MIKKYKEEINAAYPIRTELHAHTSPCSPCSKFSAEALVDALIKEGSHAVVLTNHFGPYHIDRSESKAAFLEQYLSGYRALRAAAEPRGLTVIFGIELRFRECINDYLVLGIEESELSRVYDAVDEGLKHFREIFADRDILVLQAHPDRDDMERIDPSDLDGIEVFNLNPAANPRTAVTAKWAKKTGASIIVGSSDLHIPGKEGCCLLRTRVHPADATALIEILRSGDYALEIGGSIVLP